MTPPVRMATTMLIGVGFALTLGPLDALMMARQDSNAASAFGHVSARVAGFSAITLIYGQSCLETRSGQADESA